MRIFVLPKNFILNNFSLFSFYKAIYQQLSTFLQKFYYIKYELGHGYSLKWLNIEFTSVCNLNCKFCSLKKIRKKGFIGKNILNKVLDEIESNEIKVEELALHQAGETLLHPKIKELLEEIAIRKNRMKSFPRVVLTTNATTLNSQLSRTILNSESIDLIRFSVDGGNKKDYEDMRRGANWEKVLSNIENFICLSKQFLAPPKTGIISLRPPGCREISKRFSKVIKQVDCYWPRKPHDWICQSGVIKNKSKTKKGLCNLIINNLAVLWNGEVTVCCNDLNAKGVIGNLRKSSIKEIIYSPERKRMIHLMHSHRRKEIPLCCNCNL